MSLQKYLAVLKTVELGSISRAAEQMGYTQSAVSRMIADLETEWNMEILHRGRGGVEVTSAGRLLLPVLRAIAAEHMELEHTVREIHGVHTGLVQVGTFTTVSEAWISDLLKTFGKTYPNIEFKLMHSERYDEIEEWLRCGKVDCGFVRMPGANDLQSYFLKRDMLAVVLPAEHPLAKESVIPVDRLAGEVFVKLKTDYEISQFLEHLPAPPKVRYEVSDDRMIFSMVEAGLGISVMHSLPSESHRYQVVWKPLDAPQYRDIGIAVAKGARVSGVTQLFVDHIRREIAPSGML